MGGGGGGQHMKGAGDKLSFICEEGEGGQHMKREGEGFSCHTLE